MPTIRQKKDRYTDARAVSGAIGGPATARGIGYQIDYAVYAALGLIAEHLATPFVDYTITLEPREVHGAGDARWDVSLGVQGKKVELKLNPTRNDLLEWLDRIRIAPDDPNVTFQLVYARSSGALLASLATLVRIAQEVDGNEKQFFALSEAEHIKDRDLLVASLGSRAANLLKRTHLVCIPEIVIEENITARAQTLAPEHAGQLGAALREEFLKGCQTRKTYSVREIIAMLRSTGVAFYTPKERHFHTLPASVLS